MQTSDFPFEQPGLSPTRRPSAPNESTCIRWAHGVCPKTAADCENAHHLFPQVVYRAAKKGVKSVKCVYGAECFWPPENCGFSHDGRESAAYEPDVSERERSLGDVVRPAYQEDAKKRAIEVKELLANKDWDVELKYVCKRQDCTATFGDLAGLLKHQESTLDCPRRPIINHSRPEVPGYGGRPPRSPKQRSMDKNWRD